MEALAFTSCCKGLDLEAVESIEDDVVLGNDELDNNELNCFLLGYFGAKFPGKEALLHLCDSWNVQVRFHALPSGWIIFIFGNEIDREAILQGWPYFVLGRPLVMKRMPQCFEFEDEIVKSVPVWIRLPGLPLDCWNETALSKIASMVGTPLCGDVCTSTKEKVSFARILVEVDASKMFVRSVRIKLPDGKTRVQSVVFEREPEPGFGSFRNQQPHTELVVAARKIYDDSGLDTFRSPKQNPTTKKAAAKGVKPLLAIEQLAGIGSSKSTKKRRKDC